MAQASRMAAPAAVAAAAPGLNRPALPISGPLVRWLVGRTLGHLAGRLAHFWRFDHWSKPLILLSY